MKQIGLIIADDEPYICGMLEKLIDFETLGLTLLACIHDGETLTAKIEELEPDIVLTDISMPKQDGLDVIRVIRGKGIQCRFVVISGYRQFEYAYNALKYNVDDYLLKPVERSELNQILKKLCDEIRQTMSADEAADGQLYSDLIERGIHKELRKTTPSVTDINRIYHTAFQSGSFRMFMLKLDFTGGDRQRMDDVSSVINKIRNIASQSLQEVCYEVISSETRDRSLFLINYAQSKETDLKKKLYDLYADAKNIVDLFQGISLTLCVGIAVQTLNEIERSKTSCWRANWLRMHYGLNQIIYSETIAEENSSVLLAQISTLRENLEKAYKAIDMITVERELYRFFTLPVLSLCSTESMRFLWSSISCFCKIYGQVMKNASNQEVMMNEIISKLQLQTTFLDYRTMLTQQISLYMTEMTDFLREKNAKPVMKACAYIEEHYSEHLTLETMAQIVNLSPIYFSNLFKKESGKNFTEYLTGYRMKKAKELLREGEMNVTEIANALGYSDARYFSKVFKKEIGVKPTDYRKIYG